MRFLYRVLLLVLLLTLLVLPVLAQDSQPVIVPYGSSLVSLQLEELAHNFFGLLWNAAFLPFAAPLVMLLTALVKRIMAPLPQRFQISSNVLVFSWTVLIWLLYVGATEFGYANQFESVVTSLGTVGGTILGMTLTPAAAGLVYQHARVQGVPILGYSRGPSASSITNDVEREVIREGMAFDAPH